DLIPQVPPIQLAIRLLLPEGSLLLDLPEVRSMAEPFDPRGLCYPWHNPDPSFDRLCLDIQAVIKRDEKRGASRAGIFRAIRGLAGAVEFPNVTMVARATIHYLTEPWYC